VLDPTIPASGRATDILCGTSSTWSASGWTYDNTSVLDDDAVEPQSPNPSPQPNAEVPLGRLGST